MRKTGIMESFFKVQFMNFRLVKTTHRVFVGIAGESLLEESLGALIKTEPMENQRELSS